MARNCKFPIKCTTTHTATVSRACFGKYFGDHGKELPPTTTRVLWLLLLLLLFVVCAVCRVLGVVLWEYMAVTMSDLKLFANCHDLGLMKQMMMTMMMMIMGIGTPTLNY